jgi:hypothetical protein
MYSLLLKGYFKKSFLFLKNTWPLPSYPRRVVFTIAGKILLLKLFLLIFFK